MMGGSNPLFDKVEDESSRVAEPGSPGRRLITADVALDNKIKSLESELGPAALGGLEKELGPSSVAAGGGDSPKFSPRTKEKESKVNLKRQQAKLRALARMKKNAG